MDTKVLDLVKRDALVLALASVGWRVVLRVGAEGANVDLAGADGPVRVDDDGDKGLRVLLLRELGVDVDAAEPAPVARMGVVPADDGLWSARVSA